MIIGIVAVDENWGIGRDNKLLFNLPKDMQHFKSTTTQGIVVMGYNTYLSLPKAPLPDRVNIVLCPQGTELNEGCFAYHDFDKLIEDIKMLPKETPVFIMGGAMLYKSMLPYYDQVYVTKVFANGNADTFFPDLTKNTDFACESVSEVVIDNGLSTKYCIYTKVN